VAVYYTSVSCILLTPSPRFVDLFTTCFYSCAAVDKFSTDVARSVCGSRIYCVSSLSLVFRRSICKRGDYRVTIDSVKKQTLVWLLETLVKVNEEFAIVDFVHLK